MKRSINLFFVFAVVISSATIILSCFSCLEGELCRSYISYVISPERIIERSLVDIVAIPTFIFVIAVYVDKRIVSVISSILIFVQALIVSFIAPCLNFLQELFETIVLADVYKYSITVFGVQVCILCWLLAAFSIIIVLKSAKTTSTIHTTAPKSGKILSGILAVVFTLVNVPVLAMQIYICKDISAVLCVILLLCMALIFWVYVHPIKLLSKTGNKKYALIIIGFILLSILQIIFKDKIFDMWNNLFPVIYS